MRKKVLLITLSSMIMSLSIPANPQEADSKRIVDTVYVPNSLLYMEDSVVFPIKQSEQIAISYILTEEYRRQKI